MSNLWTPEAEQLHPSGTPGTLQTGNPVAVLHVTVSPSGGDWFDAMDKVLTDKQAEPHYLWDPLTDRLGQYFPLNVSARALYNPGTLPGSPNKASNRAVIQIEAVADVDPPFTDYWQPGRNFRAMCRDITAMGVAQVWVDDRFPSHGNDQSLRLSWEQYTSGCGWVGHCHVPGNDHWDPGPIDAGKFMTAVKGEDEDDMKLTQYYNGAAQPLTRGTWRTLTLDDDGSLSIMWGPADFMLLLQFGLDGLPAGKAVKIRCYEVDVDDNGADARGHSYTVSEIVGTSGTTMGQHQQYGRTGSPAKGFDSRRLRVEALSDEADGVSLKQLSTRVFKSG